MTQKDRPETVIVWPGRWCLLTAVFGQGNVAIRPLDSLRGLVMMGSHLPIPPCLTLRNGYKQATGLRDAEAHGANPSATLNPMPTLNDDAEH
jgi:hypothetical protein